MIEYFCKDDNKLCCAACLCKIKDKGDGQHTECNACFIKDIKEEKMRILIDNINILKDIYNNLKKKYKEVKKINEKAKPKKEEIKQKIIDIFENFQKLLEKRKIELLNEVNNLYDKFFFSDDFINNYKNIISKIDDYYKKAKNVNEKWNKEEKKTMIQGLLDREEQRREKMKELGIKYEYKGFKEIVEEYKIEHLNEIKEKNKNKENKKDNDNKKEKSEKKKYKETKLEKKDEIKTTTNVLGIYETKNNSIFENAIRL